MALTDTHLEPPGRRPALGTGRPTAAGQLPPRLDARWLHDALTAGLRVADLVELLVARWEQSPRGVWISRVDPDVLLATARRLDRLGPRQRRALPLFGLPFAVKDNIDLEELPTTAGCPGFSYRPGSDAHVVARLRAAGALPVGKTNLDQFATGLVGTRSPYGVPESVYGGGLIAGGSSSGSAVAVATGQVAFALGTDTAGSGRVPAALNGLVGLKPTRGLLSTGGVVPACASLDCVSIFGTSVPDAMAVLAVAADPDAADRWSRAAPAPRTVARPLRVGVPDLSGPDMFGDTAMLTAFREAAARLGAHAELVPVDLGPLLEAGSLLYTGPWIAERLSGLETFLAEHPDAVLPLTRQILEQGRSVTGVDTFRALHRLRELTAAMERTWASLDAIALPTVATTYTLDDVRADPLGCNSRLGRYTQFANLLDCAVLAVPAGSTVDGRPASLSLVGPAFSEDLLAGLATGTAPPRTDVVALAVVGLHLSGEPRNGDLVRLGASLRGPAATAPEYRLFRLADRTPALPGLLRVSTGGASVAVEVWDVPTDGIGSLLADVPTPLALGMVRLADGSEVAGFLCQAHATEGADDITRHGGWRAAQSAHLQEDA